VRQRGTKATGWRKVAATVWVAPSDPQIYGDLEIDATRLLAFVEEARRLTDVRATVTHAVGKAIAHALAEHPELTCDDEPLFYCMECWEREFGAE
jgi:hypothetical protein